MANIIPPMLIELQLETAKIQAQMQQLNGKFDDFGKTVTKQGSFLEKFKTTASGVFAGNLMVTGLNSIRMAMAGAIKDAQEYEVLLKKTAAVIESTGNVAGISVDGLKKQANALERLSAIDENIILNGENVIATFTQIRNAAGAGNDIFNQTTKAALDLSAALGQDMQSSAIQLGKALNDPVKGVTALQRVGVTFDASQKELIKTLMNSGDVLGAQKIILAEVNREFGGAAAAAGDTFAGAIFRAKDKVADFTRDLITKLQPILLTIGKTIGDLYNKYLEPLLSFLVKNKEAVLAFVAVIGTAAIAFKTYQIVMASVTAAQELYIVAMALMRGAKLADIAATEGQTGAMALLNAVINANPIVKLITVLALLAAGVVFAWNKFEGFRATMIKVFQVIINGAGYLVGAIGKLLEAASHIPGIGSKFKGASDAVNKAADEVRKYGDSLDSLKNKKISIPGFGGTTDASGKVKPGDDPTTVTAAKLKANEKAAKDHIAAVEKQSKEVIKIYDKMDKVIADSNDKQVKLTIAYNEKVLKLKTDSIKRVTELENKALDERNTAEQKAAEDRIGIIKKGQDMLRNAFATGAAFDLADMFKDTDKSGANLLSMMRGKFASLTRLKNDAYRLAAAGYSQTFIQDIVKNGPEIGSEMANAILTSSPDVQSQMKELFAGLEDVSKYGLDALAEQMSTSTSFATKELMNEYNNVNVALEKTLSDINSNLSIALDNEASTLKDSLLQTQDDFKVAIDALTKDTMDSLAKLQDELSKTAAQIAATSGASAAISVMANSPAAPILAGVSTPVASSTGMNYAYQSPVTINQTNNINGQTSAQDIQTSTIAAIKFGSVTSARSLYNRGVSVS